MKRTHVLAVMVAVMLGGCAREAVHPDNGRYQLAVVQDGVVRLDTRTGQIAVFQYTQSELAEGTVTRR